MREITREINYNFPVGALYPDIKPFLVFSTHSQVPAWVQSKAPTYKVLLQNLQLVSYLPSLREFEPVTFKGSESESQIGAQVAELKRKYNVENQYAIEWILYSGDIVLARDYLYNLRQVKYLNLKTPYLTPEVDAVAGFDFNTTLSFKVRGQNLLNDGVDYLYITGWYTLQISYDEISIDTNFTDVSNKITTINNSIVTTNSALTSVNGSIIANNNNLITLWSGLNANTAKLGAVETKINTMQTAINSILFILENATFSPSPSPTPNPTPNPTPTPTPQNEDDMPYFASKTDLITADATYPTGQTILLSSEENGNHLGTDIWLYFADSSPDTNNFTSDADRFAFSYKGGTFLNISNPSHPSINDFKYIPGWIIPHLVGKTIKLMQWSNQISPQVGGVYFEYEILKSSIDINPPMRIGFIENPLYQYHLKQKEILITASPPLDANWKPIPFTTSNVPAIRDYMESFFTDKILPGEKYHFFFSQINGSLLSAPIQIICVGKGTNNDAYASKYTPYVLCSGEADGRLQEQLLNQL